MPDAVPLPQPVGPSALEGAELPQLLLARYRLSVAAAAVRLQRDLPSAGVLGPGGVVVVDLHFSGGAGFPRLELAHSSGNDALDDEAMALLARALRAVPALPALQQEAFSIRLPVLFGDPPQ